MSFAIHQANLLGQARAEIATKDAEIARLREALADIDALFPSEINPSNYSHEEVWEMNSCVDQAVQIARVALSPIPDPAGVMPVEVETTDDDYYKPDRSGYSRADEEWFCDHDGKG